MKDLKVEISEDPKELVSDISSNYDLLILETPRKNTWRSMLFGIGKDELAISSNCSVLLLTFKESI